MSEDRSGSGGPRTRAGRPMTGAMTAEGQAMSTHDLPQGAQVVIVGGGAVGCSVAHHPAKLGWTDVGLLEQGQPSCGATWHAARVVGQLRPHPSLTRLMPYSSQLYAGPEAQGGPRP